ncbi:sugar-binding domain-containing protein [Carboxylicivirga caseinilyticus]|uniref:glycoside hydrolase family 2 protein n=1 Tax=Carboxylicivirga caseinilyticus TaxID=3417572 RepID=UPI003D337365|nr:beta-galactosidase [Marinilabiliaceae bacterium A049]
MKLKSLSTLLFIVLGSLNFQSFSQIWTMKEAELPTQWMKDIDINHPLPEYPRPQLVRNDWVNLNGLWEFEPGKADDTTPVGKTLSEKILVPFPVESAISGIKEHYDRLWYRREFSVPKNWKGKRIILHFGAIDWESEIFINGESVKLHRGGYDAFDVDITSFLKKGDKQELIVRVFDPTEKQGIPRGKQENPPHGLLIMYTPITGIWQTVWMEAVDKNGIEKIKMTPNVDEEKLTLQVLPYNENLDNITIEAKVLDKGKVVSSVESMPGTDIILPVPNTKLWSPETPFLYDLEIAIKRKDKVLDKVDSYFAMRKVGIKQQDGKTKVYLNDKIVYNYGLLDQGYWPDGLYTAPTDEALRYDVEIQRKLGYNMVRKHLKVEPMRWYYYADKMGLMVWQDMPSVNSYIHHKPKIDTLQFQKEYIRMVEGLYNVPSITSWIIYNELQGQKTADGINPTTRMVELTRKLDPTRLINAASDNHHHDYVGDILDYHSYPPPKIIEPNYGMAGVCGEFGAIALEVQGHEWKPGEGVGMLKVNSQDELEEIYDEYVHMLLQYKTQNHMSGAVFTQLTDVEQEVNGLLTYDRIPKVDIDKIKALNEKLIYQDVEKTEYFLSDAISKPCEWKYTNKEPESDWQIQSFNDSEWQIGLSGFGNGNPPNSNEQTNWNTTDIWLRKTIDIRELSTEELDKLTMVVYYDEDCEIYINGVLAASEQGYVSNYKTIKISDEALNAIKPGKNVIAVHCKQTTGGQYFDMGLKLVTYTQRPIEK